MYEIHTRFSISHTHHTPYTIHHMSIHALSSTYHLRRHIIFPATHHTHTHTATQQVRRFIFSISPPSLIPLLSCHLPTYVASVSNRPPSSSDNSHASLSPRATLFGNCPPDPLSCWPSGGGSSPFGVTTNRFAARQRGKTTWGRTAPDEDGKKEGKKGKKGKRKRKEVSSMHLSPLHGVAPHSYKCT